MCPSRRTPNSMQRVGTGGGGGGQTGGVGGGPPRPPPRPPPPRGEGGGSRSPAPAGGKGRGWGLAGTPSVQSRCIATVVRRLGGMLLETPAHPQAGGEFICKSFISFITLFR